ncbi:MAG: 4-(cytidine 5'-diphospho)-2-C-methyl-D-erythritol kinase [Promicromonosporaceae bacterium]|nr:4-(cytidine 5'-diphospho)-2-C-methyl-D-erythritol kinase [Promicromonosporaceae bacterium]
MGRPQLYADAAPSVRVRAPGKVNLSLRVGPLQADGFHPVVTVYQAVNLYEEVIATLAPAGAGVELTVEGPGALAVPQNETNLAWRAAQALAEQVGLSADVSLHLRKGVPVAGGMAGGSADAAATLIACDALWGLDLPRPELAELAAGLGSDVPFCLLGHTAIGTGRGHLLTPVMARGKYHWVFGAFDFGLPTPDVFRTFDVLTSGNATPLDPTNDTALLQALRAGDAVALGAALHNDLQDAALRLRPSLTHPLDLARAAGTLGAIVSGSGPTVAALARDAAHAAEIAKLWTAENAVDSAWITTSPASGARIIGG